MIWLAEARSFPTRPRGPQTSHFYFFHLRFSALEHADSDLKWRENFCGFGSDDLSVCKRSKSDTLNRTYIRIEISTYRTAIPFFLYLIKDCQDFAVLH